MERKIPTAFSACTLFVAIILILLAHLCFCLSACSGGDKGTDENAAIAFDKVMDIDVQDLINYFTIDRDTAYFVTMGGIEIFDFENPASPEKICHLACSPGYRIDVENNLAYIILGGTSGIDIIDISNTSECSVVGHYETSHTYVDLKVRGNYMYLVSHGEGLEVVDISDPSTPVVLDSCFESGSYSQEWMGYSCLSVQGDYACVGQSEHGVKIVDISNPSSLEQISAIPIDKHVSNICAISDLLVVSALDELCFYGLSDILNPHKISSLDGFTMLGCIAVDNHRMVVYDDRLVGLDISDLTHPEITGVFNEYSHKLLFHKGYLISAIQSIQVFKVGW